MTEIITVTGNIASDPEQRSIGEGSTVTSFRLAAAHRKFDRATNRWIDQYTNFFSVSAFRSLGVHAFASLHRGDRVIVTGRLRLRSWDNGTASGMSADIDADGIGHDLLFGTTTYQRDGGERAAAPSTAADSTETAPAPRDGDGWAIPAAGELVGADAGAETPF